MKNSGFFPAGRWCLPVVFACLGLWLLAAASLAGAGGTAGKTAPAAAAPSPPPYRALDVIPGPPSDPAKVKDKNGYCLDCHRRQTPGIYQDWLASRHARNGVGCNDCHSAHQADKDSFLHAGRYVIRTVVTPLRCGRCHQKEVRGYARTAHARALLNLEEMPADDPRYPLVEPYKKDDFAACRACHGSRIRVGADHRPTPGTWPGSGAGRINPDRSPGNCAICHTRHRFSVASARQPEACSGCHRGRMYPEAEIYARSPHGRAYGDANSRRDLEKPGFFCGGEYNSAPTCALCHLNGAGRGLTGTHDPAGRLERRLTTPAAPLRPDSATARKQMLAVCRQCHSGGMVRRFFAAADQELERYQRQVVNPRLAVFRRRLARVRGQEREALLADYAAFLAAAKRYRLNLYMGRHGSRQR